MKPPKIRQHGWHAVNKKQFLERWEREKPDYLKGKIRVKQEANKSNHESRI